MYPPWSIGTRYEGATDVAASTSAPVIRSAGTRNERSRLTSPTLSADRAPFAANRFGMLKEG